MGTYTPNLNLYKPAPSDDYDDFLSEFNDNMDKLDNVGGSGGHTIIDKNGNDMPQEVGLQFTGGVTVTDDSVNGKTIVNISGGSITTYGAFIDTNNVIVPNTVFNTETAYTATEDCVVRYSIATSGGTNGQILVNGVEVEAFYTQSGVVQPTGIIFVKLGQTVTFRPTYPSSTSSYTVYGIQQGTNQVGVHYSTTEQVIGTWIDGKPVYQRTWTGIKYNTSDEAVISDLVNVDMLVDSRVTFKGNTGSQIAQYYRDTNDRARIWLDGGDLKVHMDSGNSYPILPMTWYITLQYTKTTD